MKLFTSEGIEFAECNIGVYIPFSKYNTLSQITALTAVFITMTAVWCIVAYYFVNHPLGRRRIAAVDLTRVGEIKL